jgi:hypothetical protein
MRYEAATMGLRASLSKALLASVLVFPACSSTVDGVEPARAELAAAYVDSICTRPAASEDGAYAVVHVCASAVAARIERLSIATGETQTITRLATGDELLLLGTKGPLVYWITRHAAGDWDLSFRDLALTSAGRVIKPSLPPSTDEREKTPPREDDEVIVSTDRKHLVFMIGDRQSSVVVADVDSAASPVVLGLTVAASGRSAFLAPDGKRVLLYETSASQTLDLDGSTGPTLGARVELSAATLDTVRAFPGTYDGTTMLIVAADKVTRESVVGTIDVTSGVVKVLSRGVDTVNVVGTHDGAAWYTARRWVSHTPPTANRVLERVQRYIDAPVQLLASDPSKSLEGHLSSDATAILYKYRDMISNTEVFTVPADGSAPPRTIASDVRFDFVQKAKGRHLVHTKAAGAEDRTALIDDVTGSTIESFPGYATYTRVSGDGTTVYGGRSCSLGAIKGQQVERLSDGGVLLMPCQAAAYFGALEVIPNSPAVLYVRTVARMEDQSIRQVTLLKP